jgi:hypothetical protein
MRADLQQRRKFEQHVVSGQTTRDLQIARRMLKINSRRKPSFAILFGIGEEDKKLRVAQPERPILYANLPASLSKAEEFAETLLDWHRRVTLVEGKQWVNWEAALTVL